MTAFPQMKYRSEQEPCYKYFPCFLWLEVPDKLENSANINPRS